MRLVAVTARFIVSAFSALLCLQACSTDDSSDPSPAGSTGTTGGRNDTGDRGGSGGLRSSGAPGGGGVSNGGNISNGGSPTSGGSGLGGSSGQTTSAGTSATAGQGAAAGASGAPNAPELKLPILRDGKYVLEFESTVFEVDPERGGRVTRFSLDGENVIAGSDQTGNPTNWGSTFWPSPQARWEWPPVASIDSQPYAAALEGNTIVLTSAAPAATGPQLSVIKRFSADLSARAIELQFSLKNEALSAESWAPWQVTRVGPNGITFFATGAAPVQNNLLTSDSGGITWFDHPEGLPSGGQFPKLSADAAEPWLAHVTSNLVFIKTFPAVAPDQLAPAQGEVEIYAEANYVEIEPQGTYALIEPGKELVWTVRWYLRQRPPSAMPRVGDAALLSFVRSIAKP